MDNIYREVSLSTGDNTEISCKMFGIVLAGILTANEDIRNDLEWHVKENMLRVMADTQDHYSKLMEAYNYKKQLEPAKEQDYNGNDKIKPVSKRWKGVYK